MKEMCIKLNQVLWDDAEKTGHRHVTVSFDSKNVMAVVGNFYNNKWSTMIVPMGYSYDKEDVQYFIDFFKVLPNLMTFLESDTVLTADEVQKYIDDFC